MHSLKTDLPYAYNDPIAAQVVRAPSAADRFAEAFLNAQAALAMRLRKGWVWHFSELTKDASAKAMKEVDAYLKPILEEAIRKNKSQISIGNEDAENETLLDHLVKLTKGSCPLHSPTMARFD